MRATEASQGASKPRRLQSKAASRAPSLALLALCILAPDAIADPPQSVPGSTGAAQAATGADSANTPAQNDANLPQVTVQAKREALLRRLREFLDSTLSMENSETAPRWTARVCPAIVGFTRDGGEFIAARLSQVAREAGVPLDGDHCSSPNLYVLATVNPTEFLKRWSRMHRGKMFGDAMPHEINAFVDSSKPVRVWYNTVQGGSDNRPGSAETAAGGNVGGNAHAPKFSPEESSRLVRSVIRGIRSAVVVIDKNQLQGVASGQLADYIAMSAFSHIKSGRSLGDAPTILKLFGGPPEQAPPGLSAWDQAFLESLYHIDPKSVMQRQQIVTRMMSHIVSE